MPHGTLSEQPPTDHFRHVYVELYVALDVSIVIVNIFPIATVFAWRKRRVPLDELIVALSVSYLLAALIPSPLGLAAYITQQWYGGAWTCALYQVTVTWLQLVAMCLVTSMCLDRWLALRYVIGDVTPRAPPNDQRRKRVRYVIAAVYVGCLVLATLPLTGLAPPALSASGRLCRTWVTAPVTMPRHHVSYVVFLVVGYANVVVAFGSNVASIAMLCRLRRRSCDRSLYRILSGPDRQTLVEFTAMTSLLSLVFYVAWVPSLVSDRTRETARAGAEEGREGGGGGGGMSEREGGEGNRSGKLGAEGDGKFLFLNYTPQTAFCRPLDIRRREGKGSNYAINKGAMGWDMG